MSNDQSSVASSTKPVNGVVPFAFLENEDKLLPISVKEAIIGTIHRTWDDNNRFYNDKETGEKKLLPPLSYVQITGGMILIAPGGSKLRGELPKEKELYLIQYRTEKTDYGNKYHLEKYRNIANINSMLNGLPAGPLTKISQVESGTEGFDFNIPKTEAERPQVKREF